MGRHNREARGSDQRGFDYDISYQPDWLHQIKVTRTLENGRQSTKILSRGNLKDHTVSVREQIPPMLLDDTTLAGARFEQIGTTHNVGETEVRVIHRCRADCSGAEPGWKCIANVCYECGDGVIQANEVCDDGNNASGDGCRPDQRDERLGGEVAEVAGVVAEEALRHRWRGLIADEIAHVAANRFS